MFMRKCSPRRLLLLGLLALGFAAVAAAEAESPELELRPRKLVYEVNVNDVIDNNVDAIDSVLMELDPMALEDLKFPVTPHIYMNLHTGWLQNLSQLKRAGKCSVRYSDKVLTFEGTLGWDEIAADYRYLLRVLLVTRKGDFHAQLSDLKVKLAVDLNFQTYQVTLRKLELHDTGKISVSLVGHIMDNIYNRVIKAVIPILRPLILYTIEHKTKEMIVEKLDMLNAILGKHHARKFTFVDLLDNAGY